jgi:hypothetical protein
LILQFQDTETKHHCFYIAGDKEALGANFTGQYPFWIVNLKYRSYPNLTRFWCNFEQIMIKKQEKLMWSSEVECGRKNTTLFASVQVFLEDFFCCCES